MPFLRPGTRYFRPVLRRGLAFWVEWLVFWGGGQLRVERRFLYDQDSWGKQLLCTRLHWNARKRSRQFYLGCLVFSERNFDGFDSKTLDWSQSCKIGSCVWLVLYSDSDLSRYHAHENVGPYARHPYTTIYRYSTDESPFFNWLSRRNWVRKFETKNWKNPPSTNGRITMWCTRSRTCACFLKFRLLVPARWSRTLSGLN